MASKYYDFYGTFKWVKNRKPDEKYDNFTVDVYMDDDSFEAFKSSGLTIAPKEDEDGRFVRFRRPNKKIIKNELVQFGPPKTVDTKGNDLSNKLIGNGSTGKVVVVVYDTIKGPGHRLEKIVVDNFVEYVKPDQDTDIKNMGDGHDSHTKTTKKARPF